MFLAYWVAATESDCSKRGSVVGDRSTPFGLVTVLMLVALLAACRPVGDLSAAPGLPELERATELTGVVFEGYSLDLRDVEVRAASARFDLASNAIHLERVDVAFREDPGLVELEADEGLVVMEREDFVLTGNVNGTTGGGERFYTEELRFDGAERRLWSESPVRVERAALTLRGDGMEVDLATLRLRFIGRVRATTGGG